MATPTPGQPSLTHRPTGPRAPPRSRRPAAAARQRGAGSQQMNQAPSVHSKMRITATALASSASNLQHRGHGVCCVMATWPLCRGPAGAGWRRWWAALGCRKPGGCSGVLVSEWVLVLAPSRGAHVLRPDGHHASVTPAMPGCCLAAAQSGMLLSTAEACAAVGGMCLQASPERHTCLRVPP